MGETSRPIRERVVEHEINRLKWSKKLFQIAHGLELHPLDMECPQFKFEVIGQYKDPLRRQLGEALHIMESGNLNRKMEFNKTEICRLESKQGAWESEERIKKKMLERKQFNEKMEKFIEKKSKVKLNLNRNCDVELNECVDVKNVTCDTICRYFKQNMT